MSRLAIVEPKTLMGEAVREAIASRASSWDQIELFSTDSEEVGAVTEVAGRAAIVQSLEDDTLDDFGTVLFCARETDLAVSRSVPSHCQAIFIDPETPLDEAVPVVAGINSEQLAESTRIVSPAPGVLLLAHLLAPLRDLGDLEVVAHVLQPASAHGKAGLDELFEQSRAILSMSDQRPEELFGTQLAFNLLPWAGSSAPLGSHLQTILGTAWQAHIHLSQAGVFHCCSAGIFLIVDNDPGAAELQDLLLENPLVERPENPELLGPVAAATADKILIGEPTSSPPRGYWLWSCMDNLAFSANNALALAQP